MMVKRFVIGALVASLLICGALGAAGLFIFTGMFLQTVLGVPEPWCVLLGVALPVMVIGGLGHALSGD